MLVGRNWPGQSVTETEVQAGDDVAAAFSAEPGGHPQVPDWTADVELDFCNAGISAVRNH